MYKKFIEWYDNNSVEIMRQNPVNCEGCLKQCDRCRDTLVGLEDVEPTNELIDAEFMKRVEKYMITKLGEKSLDPENMLDAYLSTLYVNHLQELGIIDFGTEE